MILAIFQKYYVESLFCGLDPALLYRVTGGQYSILFTFSLAKFHAKKDGCENLVPGRTGHWGVKVTHPGPSDIQRPSCFSVPESDADPAEKNANGE